MICKFFFIVTEYIRCSNANFSSKLKRKRIEIVNLVCTLSTRKRKLVSNHVIKFEPKKLYIHDEASVKVLSFRIYVFTTFE